MRISNDFLERFNKGFKGQKYSRNALIQNNLYVIFIMILLAFDILCRYN